MENLWIRENFFAEFHRQLPKHRRYEDAYEAVEVQCEKQNGRRKYSDYESFRQVLRRWIQAQRRR
jgi:hypothetical protein